MPELPQVDQPSTPQEHSVPRVSLLATQAPADPSSTDATADISPALSSSPEQTSAPVANNLDSCDAKGQASLGPPSNAAPVAPAAAMEASSSRTYPDAPPSPAVVPRIPLRRKFAVANLEDKEELFAADVRSRKFPRLLTSTSGSGSTPAGEGDENAPPTQQLRPRKKLRRLGGKP